MRFNFLGAQKKFTVMIDTEIHARLSTEHARQRVEKHGRKLFAPVSNTYHQTGVLTLPIGTEIELLSWTLPYRADSDVIKLRLCFSNTGTNLGTFYIYTTFQSLEKIELEPRQ